MKSKRVIVAVRTGQDVETSSVAIRHVECTDQEAGRLVDSLEALGDDQDTHVQAFDIPDREATPVEDVLAEIMEQLDFEVDDDEEEDEDEDYEDDEDGE